MIHAYAAYLPLTSTTSSSSELPPTCPRRYTPATEPYANWEGLERSSAEYKRKKEEAAAVLWEASPEPIQPTHPYPVPDLPLTPAQPPAGPALTLSVARRSRSRFPT